MSNMDPYGDNQSTLPMIVATSALRTRRPKIGRIGGIQLHRAVDLITLFTAAGGAILGLIVTSIFVDGFNLIYGALVGGAGGWWLSTFEPSKGTSFYRWVRLRLEHRRQRTAVDENGRKIAAYVGVAQIDSIPGGYVRWVPGAIELDPSYHKVMGLEYGEDTDGTV